MMLNLNGCTYLRTTTYILLGTIMLNSLAVWAFSFISFSELFFIYIINIIPVGIILSIMRWRKNQGSITAGFVMLAAMPLKMFYILVFLFLYNKYVGFASLYLLNFLLVYLLFLYLSIFIGVRFLSEKIKD